MAKLKTLSLLLLLLIFVGCFVLFQQWRAQLHLVPSIHDDQPDAFASNILSKQFDKMGNTVRQFDANFIFYFDDPNKATATKPFLTTRLENGNPVKIRAQRGQIEAKEHLQLSGGVQINYQHSQERPIIFRSEKLSYSLKSARATTDNPVLIQSPKYFTIQAKGATADFKNGLYTLNQHVRGTYVPATR